MKKSKKLSMLTLASASVLLGLSLVANQSKTVHADTIDQSVGEQSSYENSDFNSNNHAEDKIDPNTGLSQKTTSILNESNIDYSSLKKVQINALKNINYNITGADTGTQFTYDQYRSVAKKMINRDSRYRIPYFNAKKIKNMPATYTRDAQIGKKAKLDVWDSWIVQDEKTGKVVNYHGYQLAIAMMGIPNYNDSHIYLLYNKYGDNNLKNWKTAGPIFGFGASPLHQEWSGSATLNKDGSIQLFYTDVDTSNGDNHQIISTANLELAIDDEKGKVRINRVNNRHEVFEGDGYHYQTYQQWRAKNKGADNIAMRDAHVIAVNGKRYLIFEASTGTENYQGSDQIYNWQNYGGTDAEAMKNLLAIVKDSDMTSRATWANAALGIIRLTDDENNPEVSEVYTPLVTAPMVTDEIERPDVLKLNGKYYLFATTRLNHGTGNDLWKEANIKVGDNVAMLGWVSDNLLSGYRPLNGDAAVLTGSIPFNWRTATYSYYAVPVPGREDEVLITSYMSNRGYAAGKGQLSTWAPSFLVKINPDDTTEVLNVGTNQGDWIYDQDSENPEMIVSNIEDARLAGEPDPRKDGKLKKRYHKKSRKHHKKHHRIRRQRVRKNRHHR